MLCDHGFLHPKKAREGKHVPRTYYNQMKETLIKYWNRKFLLGLHSSKNIPDFTDYEISESNIKCE